MLLLDSVIQLPRIENLGVSEKGRIVVVVMYSVNILLLLLGWKEIHMGVFCLMSQDHLAGSVF